MDQPSSNKVVDARITDLNVISTNNAILAESAVISTVIKNKQKSRHKRRRRVRRFAHMRRAREYNRPSTASRVCTVIKNAVNNITSSAKNGIYRFCRNIRYTFCFLMIFETRRSDILRTVKID